MSLSVKVGRKVEKLMTGRAHQPTDRISDRRFSSSLGEIAQSTGHLSRTINHQSLASMFIAWTLEVWIL